MKLNLMKGKKSGDLKKKNPLKKYEASKLIEEIIHFLIYTSC